MSEYVMVKRTELARWKATMQDAVAYVNHPATSPSLEGECNVAAQGMQHALAQVSPIPDKGPFTVHEAGQFGAEVWSDDFEHDAKLQIRGDMAPETKLQYARWLAGVLNAAAGAQPGNPLDTPLPCDITVGHGTMRKGVKLGTLVLRMKVLYNMAGLYGMGARDAISQAALDVLAERQRQISAEGYTPEHDDEHTGGELAQAAACYALTAGGYAKGVVPPLWPWAKEYWKPEYGDRDLERAGALIQAELERRHRAKAKEGTRP